MVSKTQRRSYPARPSTSPLLQGLVSLAGGVALFLVFLMVLSVAFGRAYNGQVFPGISVAGVEVGGLSPEQAQALIASRLQFPETGKVVLQDGERLWVTKPADLGLTLDAQTSAMAAYNLGRQGNPLNRLLMRFSAWYSGKDLPPLFLYDERAAQERLHQLAAEIDRPTVEAELRLNGVEVQAKPGQIGRRLNIDATLAALDAQMRSMIDGILPVTIEESPPAIMDASREAEIARQMLSAPLRLQIPDAREGDPGPWTIEPGKLAEIMLIGTVDTAEGRRYQVGLDQAALRRLLQDLAPSIARYASNARFIFNDDTRQLELIQPAVIGRTLDVEASLQAINQKLAQGEHDVPLTLTFTEPQVGDSSTGEQLGIRELVSAHTSYFRGSSPSRIQNIEAAASKFHGLLVPPGAVFSMADAMGDVSLDTGYSEALIIFGGRTIKGVGGGVCQVSTTLFRTVFMGGFPVIERYPHAYRVGYYEQTATGFDPNLAGLDATVFVPVVDFKFKNDTPYWLLMETYVNRKAGKLTWKFYSTFDGRTVDWETTGPQNIVPPPDPVYEENPDLAPGEIKQVDWAVDGADVTVTRFVSNGDQVLFTDSFTTHYEPWSDVYQYGPGTEIPSGKKKKR